MVIAVSNVSTLPIYHRDAEMFTWPPAKSNHPSCLHTARRLLEKAYKVMFWFGFENESCLNLHSHRLHLLNTGIIGVCYHSWLEILNKKNIFSKKKKRKKKPPYLIKSVKCAKLHKFTWTPCKNGWKGTFSPTSHQTCQVELTCCHSSGLKGQ